MRKLKQEKELNDIRHGIDEDEARSQLTIAKLNAEVTPPILTEVRKLIIQE
jgi:hypothetical protein